MTLTYEQFLAAKAPTVRKVGEPVDPDLIHPSLHAWQRDIVAWGVRAGRCAFWADTGLGKTRMQVEWARLSGATSLVVAPLAVCQQTVREAALLDVDVRYVRDGEQVTGPSVWITNYEMVERFDPSRFDAVALDESSILKDVTAKTRDKLIELHRGVPRRLGCTATPAPNDVAELANHAEYLGAASRREMLSSYFVHDADGWRVKGHAREAMFAWMAGWALALRRPSDLGYPDDGYELPGLEIVPELVDVDGLSVDGQLFPTDLGGIGGRARVRRHTLTRRCERAAAVVEREPAEPWLLWCGLNDEATLLADLTGGVNVHGAQRPEEKAELLLAFADGQIPRLITKPSIAAFGLNWQHCARMAFVGLSDSYERYYQAIRRCYRYGQTRAVRAHIVLSELEAPIAANVRRKEREAAATTEALVAAMRRHNPIGVAA